MLKKNYCAVKTRGAVEMALKIKPEEMAEFGLLPITPPPQPGTSLQGYAVNLAQVNGYSTPDTFLGSAWYYPRYHDLLITNIAAASGLDKSVLESLTFGSGYSIPSPHPRHGGNIRIWSDRFRKQYPYICPSCWRESRLISKISQFNLVTACALHGEEYKWRCNCNSPISWPKLTKNLCQCGCKFSDMKQGKAAKEWRALSLFFEKIIDPGLLCFSNDHHIFKLNKHKTENPLIQILSKRKQQGPANSRYEILRRLILEDWIDFGVPNPKTDRPLKERIPLDWILPEMFA